MSTSELTRTASTANRNQGPVRQVTPRVEISETNETVRLHADMPGVALDGATVEIHDDVLTLEGNVENSGGQTARRYRRRFHLSDSALFDLDEVSAVMSNGVLEVAIPKAARPQPRQIKITTA